MTQPYQPPVPLQNTPEDRAFFGRLLMELQVSLGGDPPDRLKLETYWRDLHRYGSSVLEQTQRAILRSRSKRDGFPSIGEWKGSCDAFVRETVKAGVLGTREWVEECAHCGDTGWEYFHRGTDRPCGGLPVGPAADYYVRPCGCRGSNATYRRRHAVGAVQGDCAAPPPPKKRHPGRRQGALERFDARLHAKGLGATDRDEQPARPEVVGAGDSERREPRLEW